MRSSVPDGDLAKIVEVAVTEKLERLEAKRFGKTKAPRKSLAKTKTTPTSRHIPAAIRRAVYERDEGRCTYVDKLGRRCKARERLEFHHHDTPFARGGHHSLANVRLACRTHNKLLAERDYGEEKMARYRRPRPRQDRVSERVAAYAAGSPSTMAELPGAGHKRPPTAQRRAPVAML
jgi:5-methylcytosine-specific restriction endonuclease McrA